MSSVGSFFSFVNDAWSHEPEVCPLCSESFISYNLILFCDFLKVERRHTEERERRDKLSKELLGLVEQQRRYVAAVRQLTIECRRNEALLAQLRGT